MERQSSKNLDTAKVKHEVISYCPDDISKLTSKEGALFRSYNIAELSANHKLNVQLRAYVDFYGGYAEHGRRILFGLQDSGQCNVQLVPIESPVDIDPFLHQKCSYLTRNPAFKMKDSIFLCIAGPGWAQEQYIPKERYSIIWTMIESVCADPRMKEWLSNVDEIWAPTFVDCQRFVTLGFDKNVYRMPLGYDPNKFHSDVQPMEISSLKGRYVFGVLGSWNKRKGIKQIVRAFCRAFSSKDNVSLMLVCKYGTRPYDGFKDGEYVKKDDKEKWDISYEFQRYVADFKDVPHVTLIDRPVHDNVLPHLCARMQCLVGASMGESTWLPGLELMAMGKPVIQLNSQCSGFMDYMNPGNSYLMDLAEYIEADEELYLGTSDYYKGQKFAQADEYKLADMMQKVYHERNSENQQYKVRRAIETVKNWTWDISINHVLDRLKGIK